MKLEEFAKLYPNRPFALRYVERGIQHSRAFVWHIMFTGDYFTSDSDRAVYDHRGPNVPDGFGDSPEAAIDDLLANTGLALVRAMRSAEEELAEARSKLEEFQGATVNPLWKLVGK